MSLQLIVYPQSYQGQYSVSWVANFTEHVSNYTFAYGLATGTTLTTANPVPTIMSSVAPINNWQSWYSTGGVWGAVSTPTVSSNKITLDSASSVSSTGIFQLISNLVVGSQYELKIEILAGTTGLLTIGHSSSWTFNNVVYEPILYNTITPSVGTQTFTFTATNTDMVLILNYVNNDNTNLEIGSVSIKETAASAPLSALDYNDGSVIVDLYGDETIPLTLSLDNFKNIAEKAQSYSKSFNIPATKRNNKIFSSLFEITRSVKSDTYAFNPYRRTKVVLKEDGYTIFDGYLRLIDVTDKDGEISYNVNLFSETITLVDVLKDRKIKDIDFSELNHDYNKTNIKASFEGDLPVSALPVGTFAGTAGDTTTDVLKYPFVKWNGKTTKNSSNVKLTRLEDAFRPFIRCKYLVDRIISEAGFNYNSDFLNSSTFTRLFMDFNWGENINPIDSFDIMYPTNNQSNILYDSSSAFHNHAIFTSNDISSGWNNALFDNISGSSASAGFSPLYNSTTKVFTANQDDINLTGTYRIVLFRYSSGSAANVQTRWIHKDSSGNTIQESQTTSQSIANGQLIYETQNFNVTLANTDTFEIQTYASIATDIAIVQRTSLAGFNTIGSMSYCNVSTSSSISLLDSLVKLRGDMKQWDFLKGLFAMFNLLVLKDGDDPSSLIIEPYKSIFIDDSLSQYITHNTEVTDWTSKVDISEMKLKPLDISKNILFNFQKEDNDYALKVYKGATGVDYGNFEKEADGFNVLDGEQKVEATPFSATFVKPIFQNMNDFIIPVIYQEKTDGEYEGYDNKPRILYDVSGTTKITMANRTYYIPPQNGLSSENQSSYCQFSHLSTVPSGTSTKDYHYNSEQILTVLGQPPIDNLYNEYWSPYYDELYNPDTRVVSVKIYLTPSDIASFKFYNKVRIKNREYRVNKIDYKPNELSNVELILIP